MSTTCGCLKWQLVLAKYIWKSASYPHFCSSVWMVLVMSQYQLQISLGTLGKFICVSVLKLVRWTPACMNAWMAIWDWFMKGNFAIRCLSTWALKLVWLVCGCWYCKTHSLGHFISCGTGVVIMCGTLCLVTVNNNENLSRLPRHLLVLSCQLPVSYGSCYVLWPLFRQFTIHLLISALLEQQNTVDLGSL